jgi:hypothetical protein
MKTTLMMAILLGILALGVMGFRGMLQKQRDACDERLVDIGVSLDLYAGEHNGKLPARTDDLKEILGTDLDHYTGAVELRYKSKFRWSQGDPLPYLWDREAHPFIGGYHVLYTDGSVDLLTEPPRKDDF